MLQVFDALQNYAYRARPPFWLFSDTVIFEKNSVVLGYIDGDKNLSVTISWREENVYMHMQNASQETLRLFSRIVSVEPHYTENILTGMVFTVVDTTDMPYELFIRFSNYKLPVLEV